jgi:type II secretory pathway pseudopilin PulG
MRNERGASLIVLLLVLAIVGLSAWLVLSRYVGGSVDALAGAGMPLDETRQQRTITDMRTIGQAIALMRADSGAYPANLADLEASGFLARVPAVDGWGNAWSYTAGPNGFTLVSLGEDGRAGPAPPQPWTGGSHACDLVMTNGQFTQAPSERAQGVR